MADEPDLLELISTSEALLEAVRGVTLPFATDDRGSARELAHSIADQVAGYVLPRLNFLDAPLLVVVGGSTGAGKSTLVNSIVGHEVSASGVLRPTTRTPVLVHHPADADAVARARLLPDVLRTEADDHHALRVVESVHLPQGVLLLDAPDFDSVDEGNRALAGQLLRAADLWLFVMSAARYADQVPWNHLREAAERDASVAVVLDRAPRDTVDPVRRHLARMMTAHGLAESPLFTIYEGSVNEHGALPFEEIGQIVLWLQDVASSPTERRDLIAATLHGALRHNVFRARDLADAIDAQIEVAAALRADVTTAFERGAARVLDRVGEPGVDLAFVAVDAAEQATHEVVVAWSADPHGSAILAEHPSAGRDVGSLAEGAAQLAPGEQLRGRVEALFAQRAAHLAALVPEPAELKAAQERVRHAANAADVVRLAVTLDDLMPGGDTDKADQPEGDPAVNAEDSAV